MLVGIAHAHICWAGILGCPCFSWEMKLIILLKWNFVLTQIQGEGTNPSVVRRRTAIGHGCTGNPRAGCTLDTTPEILSVVSLSPLISSTGLQVFIYLCGIGYPMVMMWITPPCQHKQMVRRRGHMRKLKMSRLSWEMWKGERHFDWRSSQILLGF